MSQETLESVQNYYSKVLQTKDDLKTSACCTAEATPMHLRPLLSNIHDDVQIKFYGCGSPIPHALEGCTVLDLGCGSGRDAYLLSQLVGESGRVIGLDMTQEQLDVANQHLDWHMDKFGYSKPNTSFKKGFIEDLNASGIADNSIDVVISNCVINLSPDKNAVFSEIFRVLKPGGELYFSDVFTGRRVPEHLQTDPVLLGECLGGALYTHDFRRLMRDTGFTYYNILNNAPFDLHNTEVQEKIGMIDFYSMTISAFKCELDDISENYGHIAQYNGSIPENQQSFSLDGNLTFETGKQIPICGNTAKILTESRFAPHFQIEGDMNTHYGPFESLANNEHNKKPASGGCC